LALKSKAKRARLLNNLLNHLLLTCCPALLKGAVHPMSFSVESTTLSAMQERGHESILFCQDEASGLKGFIALHNTTLGPGLGGCRMMPYPTEAAALADVLALSEAMTYKNSLAGLPYGGGKGVIWLQPGQSKSTAQVQAMARFIDRLHGSYFTATDIGSTSVDMKTMRDITPYVSALSPEDGGLGDSSILTGYGVYMGLKAAVKHRLGRDSLAGLRIAVQGAGKVAFHMLSHLYPEGCERIFIADTNAEALAKCQAAYPNIEVVAPDAIWQQAVDVLSPNAIGGTLTEAVVQATTATLVVGGANNPLAAPTVANTLRQRNILFAPDFAVNSGGVIVLSQELAKGTLAEAKRQTEGIYDTAMRVFAEAEVRQCNTLEAAISLAKARIAQHKAS
jgi:valine dehydrogenase (NAD+)